MMDENDTTDDRTLAAEYALGLLTSQEATAFERLLTQDAGFRQEYARWASDFASLTDDIDPVDVPSSVLARIHQTIEGLEETPPAPVAPVVVETISAGPSGGDKIQGWMQKLGLLPAMAGGLAAALAVLWLINVSGIMTPAVPVATAMLASADDSLIVQITYSEDGKSLQVDRQAGAAPEGQSLELWLVRDGLAPLSLGVLPQDNSATIEVTYSLRGRLEGASCAISLEPQGGSTTGAPTGAILAVAPIVWDT